MEPVIYQVKDAIATLTLNRPEKLNALDASAYRALHGALKQFNQDAAAAVLVITGAGRAFCAGQDLGELEQLANRTEDQARSDLERIQDMTRLLIDTPKPTLAAINGPAVGLGAELSLACDLRIGRAGCYFLFPELQHELFQTNGSTWLLPRLVGQGRANEMLMLGERINDKQALEFGLLNRLFDVEEYEYGLDHLAAGLSGKSPRAMALLKSALRNHPDGDLEAAMAAEIEASLRLMGD